MIYPDVATVRVLEIHNGCPIVGFILLEPTGGTSCHSRKIVLGVHRNIKAEYQGLIL